MMVIYYGGISNVLDRILLIIECLCIQYSILFRVFCCNRAFKKAFNDVILSRRAIRNMNTLYPDATPEELAAADNVCIICREEMVTGLCLLCKLEYFFF